MKTFKYASLVYPTQSSPRFLCTDPQTCEDVLEKTEATFKKRATFTRKDLSGRVVEFHTDFAEGLFSSGPWFEASMWLLQYLLERGWEPFSVTSSGGEHAKPMEIHLRAYVDDSL